MIIISYHEHLMSSARFHRSFMVCSACAILHEPWTEQQRGDGSAGGPDEQLCEVSHFVQFPLERCCTLVPGNTQGATVWVMGKLYHTLLEILFR